MKFATVMYPSTMASYGDVTTLLPADNVTAANGEPEMDYTVISWFCFIAMGTVIFIGLFCNILSIIVLLTSVTLRSTPTGHYLIALMFADTFFLLGEFLRWLHYETDRQPVFGVNFIEVNNTACKLVYCLRYIAKLVSIWMTVVITLERCLGVTIPERMRMYSTTTKAKMVIAGVVFPCLTLGAFPLWTVRVQMWGGTPYCLTIDGVYEAWNMAVLRVGSLLLPWPIIFILTVNILVMLHARRRRRATLLRSNSGVQQFQSTAMVLAVAISCLVLRVPYTIFWYLNSRTKKWGWSPLAQYYTQSTRDVFDVLATTNYATNFFLFCLWGSTFRGQLLHLMGRSRRRPFNTSSYRSSSTRSTTTLAAQSIPLAKIYCRDIVV